MGSSACRIGSGSSRRNCARRDFLYVDAETPNEVGDPTQLVGPFRVAGDLEVADRPETRVLPGFLSEPRVEVSTVLGHVDGGLGRKGARHDQPCRVPCGAGCQLGALQQHHVPPAQLGQVIGDAAADHATADDHDLRSGGYRISIGNRILLLGHGSQFGAQQRSTRPLAGSDP
jgi:hypothetical protein